MPLIDLIRHNRVRLEEELRDSLLRWKFSPARWSLFTSVVPKLQNNVEGDVLDVGCGQMPFRIHLEHRFRSYEGLDCERRSPHTKYISDAQDMSEIADESYDTVISICVLEHLSRPALALSEMRRVCRTGGSVIVCVPFLARFHEVPHDYWRFTSYALAALGEQCSLAVDEMLPYGGLWSFVGHQVSTVLIGMFWGVPILRWVVFWINYLVIVRGCSWLDRVVPFGGTMPMGHMCVYRKG